MLSTKNYYNFNMWCVNLLNRWQDSVIKWRMCCRQRRQRRLWVKSVATRFSRRRLIFNASPWNLLWRHKFELISVLPRGLKKEWGETWSVERGMRQHWLMMRKFSGWFCSTAQRADWLYPSEREQQLRGRQGRGGNVRVAVSLKSQLKSALIWQSICWSGRGREVW